jgi:mono/diheme cytochrome c family protein
MRKLNLQSVRLLVPLGAMSFTLLFGPGLLSACAEDSSSTNTWTAPARAARKQNPITADAASISKGKDIYVAGCLPCHGASGRGDGPAAATLERNGVRIKPGNLSDPKRWSETDGELYWKITEGNSPMPAWGQTLTDDQRWLIVNYIRTLAPKTESNVSTTKTGGS